MKVFILLSIFSQSILAADLKCGHYKLSGSMTNGKARVLAIKEKNGTVQSLFLHETCPEIADGFITGNFFIHSINPNSIKCLEKKYRTNKTENNRLKLLKKIKCN
jgi:hypothetical protein